MTKSSLVTSKDGVAIVIRCNDWSICFVNDDVSSLYVNPDDSRTCLKRRMEQGLCLTKWQMYSNKTGGWSKSLLICYIIDFHLKSYSVWRHTSANMSSHMQLLSINYLQQFSTWFVRKKPCIVCIISVYAQIYWRWLTHLKLEFHDPLATLVVLWNYIHWWNLSQVFNESQIWVAFFCSS